MAAAHTWTNPRPIVMQSEETVEPNSEGEETKIKAGS